MKKIVFVLALLLAAVVFPIALADTGTYELVRQDVDLYIQNDTNVLIAYDVDFKVTGGNIPWVTIGLPNSNFDIVDHNSVAKKVYAQNGAGWTGVRVDLDKTYYPGETFNYKVSVLQKKFVVLMPSGNASIQFTPVWWDNAVIRNMKIAFHLPNNVTSVTTSDKAAKFGKNLVYWQFTDVPRGARKTVGIEMPVNGTFTVTPAKAAGMTNPSNDLSGGFFFMIMLLFVGGMLLVGGAIFLSGNSSGGDDYEVPKMTLNSALSGKKVTRNLHLKCENDDKTMDDELVDNSISDKFKASVCLLCGALFFDRGEIEKALKGNVKEADIAGKGRVFSPVEKKPKTVCPRCGGKFKAVVKSKGSVTALMYFCPDCGGICLDKGEYSNVLKIHNLQKDDVTKGGDRVKDKDNDHWLFYPYIYYPAITGHTTAAPSHYSGGSYGGGGSSSCVSHSSCVSSCACVSCACVACACACACAGGGAAGCSPKNRFSQIHLWDR